MYCSDKRQGGWKSAFLTQKKSSKLPSASFLKSSGSSAMIRCKHSPLYLLSFSATVHLDTQIVPPYGQVISCGQNISLCSNSYWGWSLGCAGRRTGFYCWDCDSHAPYFYWPAHGYVNFYWPAHGYVKYYWPGTDMLTFTDQRMDMSIFTDQQYHWAAQVNVYWPTHGWMNIAGSFLCFFIFVILD